MAYLKRLYSLRDKREKIDKGKKILWSSAKLVGLSIHLMQRILVNVQLSSFLNDESIFLENKVERMLSVLIIVKDDAIVVLQLYHSGATRYLMPTKAIASCLLSLKVNIYQDRAAKKKILFGYPARKLTIRSDLILQSYSQIAILHTFMVSKQ